MSHCRGVPRVGDSIYAWGIPFKVTEVLWFPTRAELLTYKDSYWDGYHISELDGTEDKVEAIIYVWR